MFTKTSIAAFFAGLAAAAHAPVGQPNGNPITRPLNEIVPSCKEFTITWKPTTTNPVSILLLKGPSSNVVPIGSVVESIPNSGSYTWTVPSGLTPSSDATGYGLQLIDDVNGQYQYSTQFGISNNDAACSVKVSSAGSSTPSASVSVAGAPVPSAKASSSGFVVVPSAAPSSAPCSTVTITTYVVPGATGTGGVSFPVVQPTKPLSVPASLKPSSTSTGGPLLATGAASNVKAGLGLAGAAAGIAAFFL